MGDLIDRQAVIDAICDKCLADCTPCKYFPCGEIKAIQALPSVQPNLQPTCNNLATDCISRQAAIDLFPNDSLEWDTKGGYVAPHLARRMIEELPSAQPEPCEDAVSREDAIDTLDDEITITGKSNAYVVIDYVQRVKRKLENLPSVIPKPKTGKWEIYVISPFDGEGCRCSECKYEGAPYWDYCPNCGADMRERREE